MKPGGSSIFNGSFRFAGKTINLRNAWSKPFGFVLFAFVIGATISQGSFAFADDSTTNPFRAIWEAIGELQVKTDSLQAQIDDLKSQQGVTTASAQIAAKTSDGSITVEVGGGSSGQTLVTLVARNAGPDNSVGTKLTIFYQRSLLQVNFVQGADCTDGSRGIIECYLGTLEAGSERTVTIDASPISLGQQTMITAEFSSITRDSNPADNRAETVFITAIGPVAQPAPVPAASSGSGSVPAQQQPVEQEEQGPEESPEQGLEEVAEEQEPSNAEVVENTDGETAGESGTEEENSRDVNSDQPNEETGDAEDATSNGDQVAPVDGESGDNGPTEEGSSSETGDSSGETSDSGSDGESTGETSSSESGSENSGSDSESADNNSGAADSPESSGEGGSDNNSSEDSSGGSGSDGGSSDGDSDSTG